MEIHILRLGHRPARDKRVTTHLMLAARAFGADGVIYTGTRDPVLEDSVRDICANWGGSFNVRFAEDWKRIVLDWGRRGKVVHLTMYGIPLQMVTPPIRDDPNDKLVVVGGAKVPGEVYGRADWNVAVTSQPHSEVSALAVFLHELFEGRELELEFDGARLRVDPQERGKKVDAVNPARLKI